MNGVGLPAAAGGLGAACGAACAGVLGVDAGTIIGTALGDVTPGRGCTGPSSCWRFLRFWYASHS